MFLDKKSAQKEIRLTTQHLLPVFLNDRTKNIYCTSSFDGNENGVNSEFEQ